MDCGLSNDTSDPGIRNLKKASSTVDNVMKRLHQSSFPDHDHQRHDSCHQNRSHQYRNFSIGIRHPFLTLSWIGGRPFADSPSAFQSSKLLEESSL